MFEPTLLPRSSGQLCCPCSSNEAGEVKHMSRQIPASVNDDAAHYYVNQLSANYSTLNSFESTANLNQQRPVLLCSCAPVGLSVHCLTVYRRGSDYSSVGRVTGFPVGGPDPGMVGRTRDSATSANPRRISCACLALYSSEMCWGNCSHLHGKRAK
jgi:hypothetical protein